MTNSSNGRATRAIFDAGLTLPKEDPIVRARHTAGPWRACSAIGKRKVLVAGDGDAVAVISVRERTSAEADANVSLVAAAPDLLDALRDLLDLGRAGFIRGEDIAVTRAVNAARAAIAKAEGR